MPPPSARPNAATVSPSTPASFKRCSVSVTLMSGNVGAAVRSMPASSGASCAKVPCGGVGGRDHHAPGAELRVAGDLGHFEHGRDAGVGAGQELHPLVTGPRGEGAGEGGPDLGLGGLLVLGRHQLGAAQRPAQVGEELGLDGPDGQPAPVGRLIGAVAGVATREDVVPGPDVAAQGELLVDRQRHEPEHALGDRDVEVGPLTGRGPAGQRGGDGQSGLEPTGRGVGDGGAGQRWRAPFARGAHGQEAADGQVVDVVPGPLGVRAVLPVAGGRAVDDAGVAGRHRGIADAEPVDHTRTEALDHDVGRGGQRQEGLPPVVVLEVEEDADACRGDRCRRRTAGSIGEASAEGTGPTLTTRAP